MIFCGSSDQAENSHTPGVFREVVRRAESTAGALLPEEGNIRISSV